MAGEAYSVAGIATFGWTHIATRCGADVHMFEPLSRWHAQVGARPAVQRGIRIR